MSFAQRIGEATGLEDKLRVIGEGLDTLLLWRRPSRVTSGPGLPVVESLDAAAVYEAWKETMGKLPHTKFTPERRRKVKARLKDGYSVEFIIRAIRGCATSDHHMGRTPASTQKYNDLELICRTATNLERFADMIEDRADLVLDALQTAHDRYQGLPPYFAVSTAIGVADLGGVSPNGVRQEAYELLGRAGLDLATAIRIRKEERAA